MTRRGILWHRRGSRRAGHARTFDGDDMHALDGVERAQARVGRAVNGLAVLPVAQHDCASAATALAAAELGASEAVLWGKGGVSGELSDREANDAG